VQVEKVDFVAVPSRDGQRSQQFYVETLGLRPDPHGHYEFWVGSTWRSSRTRTATT